MLAGVVCRIRVPVTFTIGCNSLNAYTSLNLKLKKLYLKVIFFILTFDNYLTTKSFKDKKKKCNY